MAMVDVVGQLADAYIGLGAKWRGEHVDRFLEVMVVDGCFLLEDVGMLFLLPISVDNTTEHKLFNLMALEQLHAGARNEVTTYIFFMDNVVRSAAGVIRHGLGSDKAVADMLNRVACEAVLDCDSRLHDVHRQVNTYCWQRWNRWRANLLQTYFRSPWAFLSLTAAVFLLALTVLQTVYTVMPVIQDSAGPGKRP
uniref:Uncharacterized protein n=1 Tax=Leersia perrieri TaxID=77586 RepID=A0A0D9WPJ1_9ORYZ